MSEVHAKRPLRVFLCHASQDKPAVRELHRRLTANGFAPWLDEEDLLPGQKWQVEIPKAVRNSDVVLVCLSQRSVNKEGYVQKEIKFALDVADEKPEGTIFLIPLRLEACDVPDRLSAWQWVNFYEDDGYARLVRALRQRAADLPAAAPTGAEPASSAASHTSAPFIQSEASIPDTQPAVKHNRRVIGSLEFVRVPAGQFSMGSDSITADEKPQHTVEIPYDYWISKYPVTNEQFAQFAAAAKYKFDQGDWKRKPNHPVVNVSWRDAVAYGRWLNELTRGELQGLTLRLPTEAEWEKAARGADGRTYPWGNDFDRNKCNSREGGKNGTTPVGACSPQGDSPYGAADMAGNVWEWCHSLYKPYPYQASDGRENEAGDNSRVLRGGAFDSSQIGARCAFRYVVPPGNRFGDFGFRVVVSPGSRS